MRQSRRMLVFAFLLTFLVNLLALTPVFYMLSVYDRVIHSRSMPTLVSLTVIVLLLLLFWAALEWIRSRLMIRLSLGIDWGLALRSFDAAFHRYVTRKNVDIRRVLRNLLTFRQFMTGPPLLAIMDAPFAVVYIIVGGLFHPYLAVFAVVAALIMIVAAFATQRSSVPNLRAANDASAEADRMAAFNMRHAETAYALGMQKTLRRRWYERHRGFLELQAGASEATGLVGGMSSYLTRALPMLQLALGAYLAVIGEITGGMVIASNILITRSIAPIGRLLASWREIVSARQGYDELNELLADYDGTGEQMRLPPPQGHLMVTDAAVIPPGSTKSVLAGLTFTVMPGETVAVVGPSASGKTSLTKLLLGIWAPVRGSVRLDGVEISDWNHDELGPHVGFVPQEIDFFEGTIAENIARLGTVDAEKVVEAAKIIGIHETILTFPNGYDTKVGEQGFVLSAGQRQRVAIARAIYGLPRYIVMDEPNSSLDDAGEQALSRAVAYLKQQGCTVILTTHRPRLMSVVDHILVLRAGTQVRFGKAQATLDLVKKMQQDSAPAAAAVSE